MRCDINISIQDLDSKRTGNRVEIKNVQGITLVEKAMEVELLRQADLMMKGESWPI